MIQYPTNGRAAKAAASATDAPLTPEEQATMQRLVAVAGASLVNAVAARLAAAGLPVVEGGVMLRWDGAIMYRVPLVVGRTVSARVLFDAIGGSTPEAQGIAAAVLAAEAQVLVREIVPAVRTWATRVDGQVQAERKRKHRGAPDDVAGDATPTPEEPRRIIVPGG